MRDCVEGDSLGTLEEMWTVLDSVAVHFILPWWLQADMLIGQDPHCLPAPCNLSAYDTSTSWRQQRSLKCTLVALCCLPSPFFPFPHFTTCVSSHLTCSCTKHLAPLLSPSLHVFASSISAHSHNCSHRNTHTHTLTPRGCGFEAAMTQSRFS